jgi:gas vesicle protein
MASRTYYSEEAAERARKQQGAGAIVVLMLGLAIGAVIALLYAPREGKKTRKMLSREGKKTRRSLSKELGSSLDSGREMADEALKDTVKALEEQYRALRGEMDKLLSSVKN